jgi:DNA-binding response OmpR family regulator
MEAARRVLVIESATSCQTELAQHGFRVLAFTDLDAAFYAATSVDAVVVHLDASDDADPRTTLVRRLQTHVATRHLPIVIAITGRPQRPDTVPVQQFGGALIVLTNAKCEGMAAVVDEHMGLARHQTP